MFKQLSAIIIFVLTMSSGGVFAESTTQKLFVNLTSDELNRAAMAIVFSTRVLTQKNIPVTLFLNVEAVRIADKNLPETKYTNDKSLKAMLNEFLQAGGRVIICPMCMENVGGFAKEDLLEGVEIGSAEVTWPALFADNTTVLNY